MPIKPASIARTAAWVRSDTPSLEIMCWTWILTVPRLTVRFWAIWGLVCPWLRRPKNLDLPRRQALHLLRLAPVSAAVSFSRRSRCAVGLPALLRSCPRPLRTCPPRAHLLSSPLRALRGASSQAPGSTATHPPTSSSQPPTASPLKRPSGRSQQPQPSPPRRGSRGSRAW